MLHETFPDDPLLVVLVDYYGQEITDALPKDAIVVSDTGHSGIWTATMIDLKHATQKYIRCAGSMGWGFPGALGVKCAVEDRPVGPLDRGGQQLERAVPVLALVLPAHP